MIKKPMLLFELGHLAEDLHGFLFPHLLMVAAYSQKTTCDQHQYGKLTFHEMGSDGNALC